MSRIILFLVYFTCYSSFTVQLTSATGTVEIRFLYYKNPLGKDSNNENCDPFGNPCDPKFTIKTKLSESIVHVVETDRQSDSNTISFGDRIVNVPNPLRYSFDKYMSFIELTVQVTDYDTIGSWDPIDFFSLYITMVPVENAGLTSPRQYVLYGHSIRTELAVQVTLRCDANYYGIDCTKFCADQDNDANGHYVCSSSGDKICRNTWTQESNCKQQYCHSNPCKNGGQCLNLASGHICKCVGLFNGPTCEIVLAACEKDAPCGNGGTCVVGTGCRCAPQYTGSSCESDLDECKNATTCANNATCTNEYGSFTCSCKAGWTGSTCSTDIDECSMPEYFAQNETSPCFNNGSCQNLPGSYQCQCPKGIRGLRCEFDVDECKDVELSASKLCSEREFCQNTLGNYTCLCRPPFSGQKCETDTSVQQIIGNNAMSESVVAAVVCVILIVIIIAVVLAFILMRRNGITTKTLVQMWYRRDSSSPVYQEKNVYDGTDNPSYREDENYECCNFENISTVDENGHHHHPRKFSRTLSIPVSVLTLDNSIPPPLPPKKMSVCDVDAPPVPPRQSVYDEPILTLRGSGKPLPEIPSEYVAMGYSEHEYGSSSYKTSEI